MSFKTSADFPKLSTIFLIQSLAMLVGMVVLSLVLSWFFQITPFSRIHLRWEDFLIGAAVAPVLLLVASRVKDPCDQAQKVLGPILVDLSWWNMLVLAAAVGFTEELLFRGVLEPLLGRSNWIVGLVLGNLIFGLAHALSMQYALVAGLLGVTLSLLTYGPGGENLFRAIVTHAVYDFLAFLWIAGRAQRELPFSKRRESETSSSEYSSDCSWGDSPDFPVDASSSGE